MELPDLMRYANLDSWLCALWGVRGLGEGGMGGGVHVKNYSSLKNIMHHCGEAVLGREKKKEKKFCAC